MVGCVLGGGGVPCRDYWITSDFKQTIAIFCYSKAFFQKDLISYHFSRDKMWFYETELRSECSRFIPHFSLSLHILRQLGRENSPDFVVLWKNGPFVLFFLSAAWRSDKNKCAHDAELQTATFLINHQQ